LVIAITALALGGPLLIHADNPDFVTLREDGAVVATLLLLVATVGLSIAFVDGRLRRRFPVERTSSALVGAWALIAGVGIVLVSVPTVTIYLTASNCPCYVAPFVPGWALVVVGLATLAAWARGPVVRVAGAIPLFVIGRGALVVAIAFGLLRMGDVVRRIVT
jgi:hypothetical protein